MKNKINKIIIELAKREISNGGRHCTITMKRTGHKLMICRTGYGAMEQPEWDTHKIFLHGEQGNEFIGNFENLEEVAEWIMNNQSI
jgi:hypothetical protein